MKPILDRCCDSRMFYFDKQDEHVFEKPTAVQRVGKNDKTRWIAFL